MGPRSKSVSCIGNWTIKLCTLKVDVYPYRKMCSAFGGGSAVFRVTKSKNDFFSNKSL